MAENHHGYGPYLGQYPPAYFPQTSVSSSTQSPYNAIPQNGGIPSTNYAASQGAYEYNANRIPGLGLGGPSIPLTSLPPSVATSWSAQTLKSQTDSHFQNQPQFSASLLGEQVPQQSVSHRPSDNALEEGELSEGEFEDLYEPKDSTDVSQTVPQNHHAQTSSALDQRNSSVGDADGSSIYDPNSPQDESMVPTTSNSLPGAEHEYPPDDEWEPSFQDRERSGSYSPYLSPREVHRKISIAKATPREIKAPNTSISSQLPPDTGISLPTSSREVTLSNGATHAASGPSGNMATASNSEVDCHVNGALPLRSPLEFKKKAQEAILGLWPLKVRYQDYIEEGLDADVVKALFKDLGLDASVSKPATASAKPVSTSQAVPTTAATVPNTSPKRKSQSLDNKQPLSQDTKHPDNKDNNDKSSEVKVAEKSAAEERKDKIARKLAAMAQKTTTTQPPVRNASAPAQATAPPRAPSPAPIPVSAPTEETATAAPIGAKSDTPNALSATPKTRAENNAILQQKLAALKKQQAQLAADKALAASNESTAASSPTAAEPNSTDVGRNGVSTSKVTTTPLAQPNSNQRSQSAERRASSKDESIPGLSVSLSSFSQPAQGSTRNLKRPVASDFDNYTPRSQSLKRSRTEERLIIDVSDDEDVEMDMGSPTDELVTSIEPTTAPTRQSLSAFPPLSDTPTRRQRLSPASSSAPTPPAPGAKLDLLHKRIEETKRLIAEAEAKKAAKKATSQQSPRPSSPITQQSVKLPKANEASAENKVAGTHRRERIMSYELPRINATLKEKQDKLKWIVAQAAQLELEVQASLDEQQKLTAEVERLVDFSGEDSLQPEEQPLQATITTPNAGHVSNSNNQQYTREPSSSQQSYRNGDSPITDTNGEMDANLNNDEALQAAILTDHTHSVDRQMADITMQAPHANDSPSDEVSSSPSQSDDQAHTDAGEMAMRTGKVTAEISTSPAFEAGDSIAESVLQATSTQPSEPDIATSDSDISMQQSAPELTQSDDESYEPTPAQISNSRSAQTDEQKSTEVADNILEEPNPYHTSGDPNAQGQENTNIEDEQNNSLPLEDLLTYKSPLSYFRAYRFHPRFFEEVPGGLKSMTYSAKIDPMREVCPQVLAGEQCPNGANCEYQHFDSMVLPDAEIITQLGASDMFAGETRTKFIDGLKKVLNDLRANRVKDFDRITRAIVKHRQEFLDDKTKVLALDSSTA